MSANGMKPEFTDWTGYQKWLSEWRDVYKHLSGVCKARKRELKSAQCNSSDANDKIVSAKIRNNYSYDRIMATKMMTLRTEATIRWKNIKAMYKSLSDQAATFPIKIEGAKNIDFHFNKKHLEFPKIPMWTMRAQGKSFYINHLSCQVPWTTKEKPDDVSTKGMIRIKKGDILITAEGEAIIS